MAKFFKPNTDDCEDQNDIQIDMIVNNLIRPKPKSKYVMWNICPKHKGAYICFCLTCINEGEYEKNIHFQ